MGSRPCTPLVSPVGVHETQPMTAEERVRRWKPTLQASGLTAPPVNWDDAASITSQSLPRAHPSMFLPPQPRPLGEGQTPYDWDVEGQKSYSREEWLPGVENQLLACETAAQFLAESFSFEKEAPEVVEPDNAMLGTPTKDTSQAHDVSPFP